jgi:hypothetical protein
VPSHPTIAGKGRKVSMKTEQSSKTLSSLKTAGSAAFGLGLLYAIFMTVRDYIANAGVGPSLGITFALSLLYCAVPLFVVLFLVIGVIMALQNKNSTER